MSKQVDAVHDTLRRHNMPRNLLVVFGDEMRAQSMGCSGNPDVRTPNMDLLARQGTRFARAYSNSPVCTPARGTILTGLYPTEHGALVNDVPVSTDVTSIAHILGGDGYRCGYIGKWHLDGVPRDRFTPPGPRRLGFDDYWAAWNCSHSYLDARYFLDDPEPVVEEGYEPTVQTNLAHGFLDDHVENHRDDPFCLFLSWAPPHDPYCPWPPGSEGTYDPAALELPPNCDDTAQHRDDLAGYYAHITALDDELGRLMDHLAKRGLADDTLVVFMSDHGSMLGSHGLYHKQQPSAESLKVPMIFRAPGRVPPGLATDLPIGLMDFVPTVLGLLDHTVPGSLLGDDLSAQIARGDTEGDRTIYASEMFCIDQAIGMGILPWRGIVTPRHTYARNLDGPWVLFDDVSDPHQMNNLIDDPAHVSLRDRFESELERQMERHDDLLMRPDEVVDKWGIRDLFDRREEYMHRPLRGR